MDRLLLLHDLQKTVRHTSSLKDLEFQFVNAPYKLVPYEQAIFWLYDHHHIRIRSVSGGGQIDTKSPFSVWFCDVVTSYIKSVGTHWDGAVHCGIVKPDDMPQALQKDWADYAHKSGLLIIFKSKEHGVLGGLWFDRKTPFNPAEAKLLEELCDQYCASLQNALETQQKNPVFGIWGKLNQYKKAIFIGLVFLCFLPVRLSITAPAEIVAKDAEIIAASYDGIVREVLVVPGSDVQQGQDIVQMDQTVLKAEAEIAKQALDIVRANISQTKRVAISNPEKNADLGLLREELKLKQLEYDYAQQLLQRSTIQSNTSGVAIYADKSSIEGAPFATGQTILQIANPQNTELLLRIPIDSLVPFNKDHSIRFYLNMLPLKSIKAQIHTLGFQASPDPDGLLSYKARADIAENNNDVLRIGWKGSAKIYGHWTVLSYAIIRRPLASLRQIIGV